MLSQAFAMSGAPNQGAGGGFDLMAFMPIILIFAVFYFLLIRPQQKKLKAHQEMVANLRRGDRVITNGGIIGVVSKVISDREVALEIAEGVRVRVLKSMVSEVMSKTEPVTAEASDFEESNEKESLPAKPKKRVTRSTKTEG